MRRVPSPGLPFPAAPCFPQPVSGSFHPPSGVLFSFPSRYSCAIGLGTYLALGAGLPQLPERMPTPGTRGHGKSPTQVTPTGLSPSTAPHSRGLRLPRGGSIPAQFTPHPPDLSARGSVWALPLSVAPTHGIACCFLFLRVLRCFSSPRSRASSAQFGDPRFDGCMRLAGAYRSLPRPSSAPEPSHPPAGLTCAYGPFGSLCVASSRRLPFPREHELTRCILKVV